MVNDPYPFSPIPFFDLGGAGLPLHFLHANGYPPECYKPLLELLQTQYHVFGMLLRPLWPGSNPNDIQDWKPFSDDLLRFLASHSACSRNRRGTLHRSDCHACVLHCETRASSGR